MDELVLDEATKGSRAKLHVERVPFSDNLLLLVEITDSRELGTGESMVINAQSARQLLDQLDMWLKEQA